MQLNFPANKSIDVMFKVGIAGTQSPPSTVAIVLEKDGTALSYSAIKQGDDWVARIDKPGTVFSTGEVKMHINVILNNYIFTPMKSTVNIIDDETIDTIPDVTAIAQQTPADNSELNIQQVNPNKLSTLTPEIELKFEDKPNTISSEIKKVNLLATIQKEANQIPAPAVKLQLLKSIEPGILNTPEKVNIKETIKETAPVSVFKLKKLKVIFK